MKRLTLAPLGAIGVLFAHGAQAQNIVQQAPTTFSGTDFQRTNGVISLKAGGALVPPTASTLGGVFSSAAGAGQFATGINTSGAVTYAQPVIGNISGLDANVATWLATPSSVNLATAVTGETGSGALVFGTSPTLTTATLAGTTTLSGTTGVVQCLQANTSGVISGTGSACGTGGGGTSPGGSSGDIQINSSGVFGGLTPGAGVSAFLTTPSSANLATAVTGETGTGALVFGTSPTFTTGISVNGTISTTGAGTIITSGTNGAITTGGSNAGLYINERDGTGTWTLYANGDLFRVYNGGDLLTVNATGDVGVPSGKLTTKVPATGGAGLNLPHGTAPTTPVNGDLWTTTAGVYARVNGGTVGPFGAAGGSGLSGMTAGQIPIAATASTVTSSIPLPLSLSNGGTGINAASNAALLTGIGAVAKAGDTITGALTLGDATGWALLNLDKATPAGNLAAIFAKRGGVSRWNLILGDGAAESGGNAGSDFYIQRFNDAGTFLDTPLSISRATGAVSLGNVTGASQCLQANSSGVVTGTGSACGSAAPTIPAAIGWVAGVDPAQTVIFTASRTMTVTDIRGRVVAGVGSAATAQVNKAPSGTACSAGTAQHTGTFDANGTANTNQSLTLSVVAGATTLAAGDSLCLLTTGTWTAGAGNGGITVTVQ